MAKSISSSGHPPIIIFDVDGVLLNSRAHELVARMLKLDPKIRWNRELMARTTPMEILRKFEAIDARSSRQFLRGLFRIFRPLIPSRRSRIRFLYRMGVNIRKYEFLYADFFPGVPEALRELAKRGILLGICTNAEAKRLKTWFQRKGVADIIHTWVTRDDKKKYGIKPSGTPVLGAVFRIKQYYRLGKIDRNRVAFVGDNCTDIIAGEAAKVKTIAVLSGHGYRKELEALRPTLILNSIADLPKYIDSLFFNQE
jgi:phosphoglycolate phosphatase-like HAD superfamily hydrolase